MRLITRKLFLLAVFGLLAITVIADPIVGPVTQENSIIGQYPDDFIGAEGEVYLLPSGNIVIASPQWNNWRGAVTCLTPAQYQAGSIVVSAANSLVGSTGWEMRDPRPGGEPAGDYVGKYITVLANGNYVVASPNWFDGIHGGAVTWVNGNTCIPYGETSPGAVVGLNNSLVGSMPTDRIGSHYGGVVALTNGNYVVSSSYWQNGVGAVTWGNGKTGIAGIVSAENSLVGSAPTPFDMLGDFQITALNNGNYVVRMGNWDDLNAGLENVGAVTWANGITGISGTININNSLIGTIANPIGWVTALANGNYVVSSTIWDNGAVADVGAVTWANGRTGLTGTVNPGNSLIGTTAGDQVGYTITPLANGNYVVGSEYWDNGAVADVGAATWANGMTGLIGTVNPGNSLIGSIMGEQVSREDIVALTNGHYVVGTRFWSSGGIAGAGAVTWGNGITGTVGIVDAINSLVGTSPGDEVGSVIPLMNGNYVVTSFFWDNGGIVNAGAVTWGNGLGGTVGAVSVSNSLVGTNGEDQIGISDVKALTNGNYVITSDWWDNGGVVDAGAVTWGNGSGGTVGVVSESNSLVGTSAGDGQGRGYTAITALTNGNYVVKSPSWDNGGAANVGAVTWGNGMGGTTGAISSTNSLVGVTAGDQIGGYESITALDNGNYVVGSHNWNNGTVADAGAATWGNGVTGTTGFVGANNSLVGTTPYDYVGMYITALNDGHYIVHSPNWHNAGNAVSALTFNMDTSQFTELLTNPGFENHLINVNQPDNWMGHQLSKEKLKCNTFTATYARSGMCAYRFVGNLGEKGRLLQNVYNTSGLTGGTTLYTRVYYKTNDISPNLRVKVKVFYTGGMGAELFDGMINRMWVGSYIRFDLPTYTIKSAAPVEKIKLQFQNKATGGRVYLDDVSMGYYSTA